MTTDFTTCAFSEGAGRVCGSDGGGSGLGHGEETRDQLLSKEGGWRSQCRGKVGMGPAAVSGRPSAGEGEDEAAAAAGTGKERAEAKAVTEEGEGLKAGFDSHGTGGWADSREKGTEGELFGLVKQPGCFFQTRASGCPLGLAGRLGAVGAAGFHSPGGQDVPAGGQDRGPFGPLIGGGFCSSPTRRLQQWEGT